jgi:hypothetical protein
LKIRRESEEVVISKVVPNYIFYLHENFQYFPRFLSIFLAWKIDFGVYLNQRNSHRGAHLSACSSLRAGAPTSGISFHLESMPSAASDINRQLISTSSVRSRQPLSILTTPLLSGAPRHSPIHRTEPPPWPMTSSSHRGARRGHLPRATLRRRAPSSSCRTSSNRHQSSS